VLHKRNTLAGPKVIQGQHEILRHLRRVRLEFLLGDFHELPAFVEESFKFFCFFPTRIGAQHKDCSFACHEQRTVRGMLRSVPGQNKLLCFQHESKTRQLSRLERGLVQEDQDQVELTQKMQRPSRVKLKDTDYCCCLLFVLTQTKE